MARTSRIASVPMVETPVKVSKPRPTKAEREEVARLASQQAAQQAAEAATLAQAAMVRRYCAYSLAGAGTVVLALSLVHSSAAIADLTHQHIFMGWALAIGIDVGLLLAEVAHLFSRSKETRRWAMGTVGLTVVLSIVLNTHTCWHEIQWMRTTFAWVLGIVVPILVLLLGRIASHLMEE